MTRINVFSYPVWAARMFVGLGVLMILLGIIQFIFAINDGFDPVFRSGDWGSVFSVFQGILFIIMGTVGRINRRYYLEWDEDEMRYLVPGMKQSVSIKFADIKSVQLRLFEVRIHLAEGIRVLDLNNLQFEDLRNVKEKFEMLARSSHS